MAAQPQPATAAPVSNDTTLRDQKSESKASDQKLLPKKRVNEDQWENLLAARKAKPCRLMIYNVAKKKNCGDLIRSCVAFGVSQIIIVGNRKITTFGNHNTNNYVEFVYYEDVTEAVEVIKKDGFRLVGVEIVDGARSIASRPFTGPTCFVMGNEGQGLNEKVKKLCDDFVFIPQHGVGTASLNVSVACGIVLYNFAQWAGYPEAPREGEKFVVDETRKIAPAGLHTRGEKLYSNAPRKQKKAKLEHKVEEAKSEKPATDKPETNTLEANNGSEVGTK